MSWAK